MVCLSPFVVPARNMPPIRHDVTFTGQAESYAPIWRQNMLLLVLTAGFSLPWALSRSLRYFYQHTEVAGGRFDYHASPLKMFAGNVVGTILLNVIYYGISLTGPYKTLGVAAMQLLTAALLPLWLHGLLEFQLMHTSWRGHRMKLAATPGDAFKAMGWPTLLYIVGGVLAVWAVVAGMDGQSLQAWGLGAGAIVVLCVALPWLYVQYKRYQHRHAQLGSWRHQDPHLPGGASVSHLTWRAAGLAVLAMLLLVVPACIGLSELVGVDGALLARLKLASHGAESIRLALVLVPGFLLLFVLMMALPYAYLSVHLQNHLWPATRHAQLRVESALPAADWLRLSARHWALVVCTLGWYYPKAAVAQARLRLQAVSVWVTPEALDELMSTASTDAPANQPAEAATVASPQ